MVIGNNVTKIYIHINIFRTYIYFLIANECKYISKNLT